MTIKPMLAATANIDAIEYPCVCSPKLDGIRVLGIDGRAMTRTLKEIPNRFVQSVFASGLFDGLDGEIIVGPPNAKDVYRVTNSAVMSRDGEPDFTFHVFDRWDLPEHPFIFRHTGLYELDIQRATIVPHRMVSCLADLHMLEEKWLAEGYEGLMGRRPDGGYKHGRATMREGVLWKLKRFVDHEYPVIGFEELMHNENEATTDELGHTKRSSHMENKRGGNVLGALVLRHPSAGEFRCGTGFSMADRAEIWRNRNRYLGRMAKVKHFEIGVKDLPRFPVFLGWRAEEDL